MSLRYVPRWLSIVRGIPLALLRYFRVARVSRNSYRVLSNALSRMLSSYRVLSNAPLRLLITGVSLCAIISMSVVRALIASYTRTVSKRISSIASYPRFIIRRIVTLNVILKLLRVSD